MGLTTDPSDPRLGHGVDEDPIDQHEVYLVLSDEERAKGFARPYRDAYRHVGPRGPRYPTVDLTPEQVVRYVACDYTSFEPYPESDEPITGRYWTQEQLDRVDDGCGAVTTMGRALAETYARQPDFYGATYCVRCSRHLPVGANGEFVWLDGSRVGT